MRTMENDFLFVSVRVMDVRYALACRFLAMASSLEVIDKLKHIGHPSRKRTRKRSLSGLRDTSLVRVH